MESERKFRQLLDEINFTIQLEKIEGGWLAVYQRNARDGDRITVLKAFSLDPKEAVEKVLREVHRQIDFLLMPRFVERNEK